MLFIEPVLTIGGSDKSNKTGNAYALPMAEASIVSKLHRAVMQKLETVQRLSTSNVVTVYDVVIVEYVRYVKVFLKGSL